MVSKETVKKRRGKNSEAIPIIENLLTTKID